MRYCNIRDKTIYFKSKSKQNSSTSHKHKEKFSVVVKEFEYIGPDIERTDLIINNCARDCFKKYFHTFKHRCICNIEITNGDFVKGVFSEKKLKKIARGNGFIYKLTIKISSSPSNVNICYYLIFPIPIMNRHFFRIISQKPDYLKTFCNDLNTPFHSACCSWMINQ